MEMKDCLTRLAQLQQARQAYMHAMSCLQVDGETAAPRAAAGPRGETMAFLSQKSYELLVNPETSALLTDLWEKRSELDEAAARQVYLLRKEARELTCIPVEEYAAYSRLVNDASSAWVTAKQQNDYASFEPYLARVIETERRFAAYRDPGRPAYDVMLDTYEPGMSTAVLDPFFAMLRSEIVPLMEQAKQLPALPAFVSAECPISAQRELSAWLMNQMGLDPERCTLAETEHPFTCGMNRYDVRITTHYHTDAVLSSMYSVIHEGGHALYELGFADEYANTVLSGSSSTGMHESQSRFYENLIGHHPAFLRLAAGKLRELFPETLGSVSDDAFLRAVNHVQPSLIRTEADQVTYPLHIMVRYELEKQLIAGTLSTKDLPAAWNALYKEYLGVDVPSDTCGVLQDTHWSGGMFGYFPTYALGSAYASQLMHAMRKDVDVDALLERGDLAPITEWLQTHVHCCGALYDPAELLLRATGEAFDPSYYVTHLKHVVASLLQ